MQKKWEKAVMAASHIICITLIITTTIEKETAAVSNENNFAAYELWERKTSEPVSTLSLLTSEESFPLQLEEAENSITIRLEDVKETASLLDSLKEIMKQDITSKDVEDTLPESTEENLSESSEDNTDGDIKIEEEKVQINEEEKVETNFVETGFKTREQQKQDALQKIEEGVYDALEKEKYSWWFVRKKNQVPSGSGAAFSMGEYDAYYRNETVDNSDKVIYMTIDCGYESSNTKDLLDIFKEHEISVLFFVTKHFIKSNPEDVQRMVAEGHLVGNHSVNHKDLTKLTQKEIYEEIIGCEEAFYDLTGRQMDLYFRPPEGTYSKQTLQITKDLGYQTIFWSIAYKDYDRENQPGKEYVIDHFKTYHHNGAIPLMHNDSDSNREAMEEVVTFLEEQGYRFGTLDELTERYAE